MENYLFCNDSAFIIIQIVQGLSVPAREHELLNRLSSGGLTATYKYTRTISIFSPKMVSIELTFTNAGEAPYTAIKIGDKVCIIIHNFLSEERNIHNTSKLNCLL